MHFGCEKQRYSLASALCDQRLRYSLSANFDSDTIASVTEHAGLNLTKKNAECELCKIHQYSLYCIK